MESLPHMERFDIHLLGYCDIITQAMANRLSWKLPEPVKKSLATGIINADKETEKTNHSSSKLLLPLNDNSVHQIDLSLGSGSPTKQVSQKAGSPLKENPIQPKSPNRVSVVPKEGTPVKEHVKLFSPTKKSESQALYKAGELPWIWLFEGAIQKQLPSSSEEEDPESSSDGDCTPESPIPISPRTTELPIFESDT